MTKRAHDDEQSHDLNLVGNGIMALGPAAHAAIELRLGLEPGAIGTTHSINEAGHVLDGGGHIVGLTAANPGGLANWLKIILLDYAFGGTVPGAATTPLFVGLGTGTFTGGTTDIATLQNGVGGSGALVEVTTTNWTNYARVSMANTTAQWTGATGVAGTQVASKVNTNAISFTANATVTGTGPTPTCWFISNSSSLGAAANLYAVGNISSGSAAVVNGAAVSFAAGAIGILLT